MIDFGLILVIAMAALMAVQAMDVECETPAAPRRRKGSNEPGSAYVPVNTVIN